MSIILLDIDGVMVPATGWKAPELGNDGLPNFSKNAVIALKKILSETNASILLTTSHVSKYTIDVWRCIFSDRNIQANITKLNTLSKSLSRKDEILSWLQNHHDDERFVIIDDDQSLYDISIEYKHAVVITSPFIGLNEDIANKAIQVFNNLL